MPLVITTEWTLPHGWFSQCYSSLLGNQDSTVFVQAFGNAQMQFLINCLGLKAIRVITASWL